MGQAAGEVVFAGLRPPCGQPMAGYLRCAPVLETMEAATHAPPESARVGGQPQQGAHGDTEPQRLLADESE